MALTVLVLQLAKVSSCFPVLCVLCCAVPCCALPCPAVQSAPIVRVAVEPARPEDMPALVEGLRLLHHADPMVQVTVQDSGEHVLCAAGALRGVCLHYWQLEFFSGDVLPLLPPACAPARPACDS